MKSIKSRVLLIKLILVLIFATAINTASAQIINSTTPVAINTTYGGTPTAFSTFTASGANLTGNLVITAPPGFEVSLDNSNYYNVVTINGPGSVGPKTVYIRLKQTDAVNTYSGNIVLSSPGAQPVNVAMPPSTVSPLPINISTHGSMPYGAFIDDFTATPSNFDFTIINNGLKNGETSASLDISFTGGNLATDPVGTYNNVVISSNFTGANGFLASNYLITYSTSYIIKYPAPLVITANNVSKIFGNTLTNEANSAAFTITGLQNSETISSVSIAYGNGSAANAPIGTYTGSVVASAPVGGNGFLATNYAISYTAGTLSVVAPGPSVTATAPLKALTTVYGTPSSSTTFTVSGSSLTAGIIITAPAGFEVSADNITFSNTVPIGGAGTVTFAAVYIRLKQTTFVGSYTGSIGIKSAGAADVNQTMPTSTVTPAPLLITANNATKVYGNLLTGGPGSTAFTISGLQNAETAGTVTIVYGNGAGAAANVGSYNGSVTPSAVVGGTFTAGNYTPTYQAGSITVTPASLIVTADDKSKYYGDANPAFTVTYTGFLNSDGIAQITTQPVAVTTAAQSSPVGQYPINVSGAVAANYTFAYVSGILTVNPVPYSPVTIPNAFTPNGDGINDVWNINNLNTYPKTTVEILNRYGTRVFFSNNYPIPWDGRYNGVKVPDGTYYYIITGVNNKPLTGYVAVIQ